MSNPFEAAIKAIKMEMETDTFYNAAAELWSAIHVLEAAGQGKAGMNYCDYPCPMNEDEREKCKGHPYMDDKLFDPLARAIYAALPNKEKT